MEQDNHDQLMQTVGGMKEGIKFLVEYSKKNNGYIDDFTKQLNDHDNKITNLENEWKRTLELISRDLGEIHKFIKEQNDKKNKKNAFFSFITENWLVGVLIIATTYFFSTFLPSLWTFLKHHWSG